MRWTIRQILVALLIVALVIPYLMAFFRKPEVKPRLSTIEITGKQVLEWVRELEPNTVSGSAYTAGSRGATSTWDSSDWTSNFLLPEARPETVFEHVRQQVQDKLDDEGWRKSGGNQSNEACFWEIQKGESMYRIYIYSLASPRSAIQEAARNDNQIISIKFILIGFTARSGYFRLDK